MLLHKDDIYKTIFIGENGEPDQKAVVLAGPTIAKLLRFKPIGYGQNVTTVFRGDGTVEIHGMTQFRGNDDK